MDIRKVKKLIELLEESGVAEIEISEGEESVRISRYSTTAQPTPTIVQDTVPLATSVAAVGANEASATALAPVETSKQGHEITAPMVGTFYHAPAPDAQPYVKMGSSVSPGDTVCIIEAMKLMNELESEVSGAITEILVENAQPVEFGQVLFRIDPT